MDFVDRGTSILMLMLLVFIIFLAGCEMGNGTFPMTETEFQSSGILEQPSDGNTNMIDYDQLKNKIWVEEHWEGDAYYYPSFFFTYISESVVRGYFSTNAIARPNFFKGNFEGWPHLGTLEGNIQGNSGECYFVIPSGNSGNMELMLIGTDKVEATIEYTTKERLYKDVNLDGTFSFRPYNLSDIEKRIDPDKTQRYGVELSHWGKVDYTVVWFTGCMPYADAFLMDEDNNIVYDFKVPFQVGIEITSVAIADLNGDGLLDIHMLTDTDEVVWYFYQMEDGLFYMEK